jgi:hypothetical protein
MTTQHTPGPWKAAHAIQDDAAARYIWSMTDKATGHRELVATIPYAEGDHINADARLISAAPDLLAALQDLLAATEETYDSRHERQAALDAINKATGDAQ